jgi:hypothetical protein
MLSPIFLSSPTCYRMMRRGLHLTPFTTNNTGNLTPFPLRGIQHFTYPYQNSINARSLSTTEVNVHAMF